nr:glycoside hydrolase family 43 protein [Amphibacillus sediminis]
MFGIFLFPKIENAASLNIPHFQNVSVHDPSVIKVDDTFYVFGSHLAAAKSTNLMQWQQISTSVSRANPLFEDVFAELEEAFTWANTNTLWAADVTQVGDKYYMYYNACEGSSPRSAMGLAVADHIEGPYVNQGIFLKSGMWGELSPDGTIYDPTIHPNAIDPHAFFDADGRFWLLYGSYSGGIFILELDPVEGIPFEGQGYGKHLIGGNHVRIEGPYMQYDASTGYYYLHLTYGGLDAAGGYNMRVMRSRNPDGPFVDAVGNRMDQVRGPNGSFFDDRAIEPYGVKLMGNFFFERYPGEPGTGRGTGYISPGHNSVYTEENGESFIFFHTRFPGRGEAHEVRVHRLIMNRAGWPIIAPYRYAGESIESVGWGDVVGTYKFINHGLAISADVQHSSLIELHANGAVSGAATGYWWLSGDYYITLNLTDGFYEGVALRQWNETLQKHGLVFSAIGNNNMTIVGSKTTSLDTNGAAN